MKNGAEVQGERGGIGRVRERLQHAAVFGFINLRRSGKAQLREFGGEHARMRGLAGVQPLAHGAVGIESPEACALGSGESKCPCGLLGIELQQRRARGGGPERTAYPGQMPAAQPRRRRIEREARADHHFVAGGNRGDQIGAARVELFGDRDRRGYYHRARMQLGVVVVVKLERVGCGAIDECRIRAAQRRLCVAPDVRIPAAGSAAPCPLEQHLRPRRAVAVDARAHGVEHRDAHDFARAWRQIRITQIRDPVGEFPGRCGDCAAVKIHG